MMKNNKIIGILVLFCVMTAGLSGGCAQTPPAPEKGEAAVYPITSVYFPDGCTDFTGAQLATVRELCVSEENEAYTAVDGVIFTADLKTLVAFPAGRDGAYTVPDGTEAIGASAFADCRIEEIYIPDSVTAIGNKAFDGCMSLKEISFPTMFEADGNILPHCEALPEYIIAGLRVHHRGHPNEIKDKLRDILPEMNPYRTCAYRRNEIDPLPRTLTLYEMPKKYYHNLSTGAIDEIVYTTLTAEYLMNGGDVVIPEGYRSWTYNDVQCARFPITSVTFPNNCGEGEFALFEPSFVSYENANSMLDYYVKEDNPRFVSVDGIIFTKDLKSLAAFPAGRTGHYDIPDGTEYVMHSAFQGTRLESIYVPDSVRSIEDLAFSSLYLKEISLPTHTYSLSIGHGDTGIKGSENVVFIYRTAE